MYRNAASTRQGTQPIPQHSSAQGTQKLRTGCIVPDRSRPLRSDDRFSSEIQTRKESNEFHVNPLKSCGCPDTVQDLPHRIYRSPGHRVSLEQAVTISSAYDEALLLLPPSPRSTDTFGIQPLHRMTAEATRYEQGTGPHHAQRGVTPPPQPAHALGLHMAENDPVHTVHGNLLATLSGTSTREHRISTPRQPINSHASRAPQKLHRTAHTIITRSKVHSGKLHATHTYGASNVGGGKDPHRRVVYGTLPPPGPGVHCTRLLPTTKSRTQRQIP